MFNTSAYLNLLTKQKEILIKMESHRLNLQNMKSITKNSPQLKPVSINKNKHKYIKSRSQYEIDLENQILTEKIQKIIKSHRNSKYYSANSKYSKSLNGHVKRTTQQKIKEDNLKFLQRLQQSKPTYQTKKYLEQFQHLRKVQRNMSSVDFNMTDSPNFRKRHLNTNRSFVTRRDSSVRSGSSVGVQNGLLVKQVLKLNDNKYWEVKVYLNENKREGLKITGEKIPDEKSSSQQTESQQQVSRQIKVISMPIAQANIFIVKNCENKIENILNHLKVDQNNDALYIEVPKNTHKKNVMGKLNKEQKGVEISAAKFKNTEDNKSNDVKLKKLQQLSGYQKKKVPSRHIFNTAQNKPALLGNLIKENNQKQSDSILEFQMKQEKTQEDLKQSHEEQNDTNKSDNQTNKKAQRSSKKTLKITYQSIQKIQQEENKNIELVDKKQESLKQVNLQKVKEMLQGSKQQQAIQKVIKQEGKAEQKQILSSEKVNEQDQQIEQHKQAIQNNQQPVQNSKILAESENDLKQQKQNDVNDVNDEKIQDLEQENPQIIQSEDKKIVSLGQEGQIQELGQ